MLPTVRLATYALLCLLMATGPAYAYLDPGTGSILLQGLVAAVAGGLVAARLYWSKVKEFLSFASKKSDGTGKNSRS